jgi:PRTRC genetic system ThiF family protein
MQYLVESSRLILRDAAGNAIHRAQWDATIVVVGCGGTGSLLVPRLCRLLLGRRAKLVLVDHDQVEPHNIGRQDFLPSEIGAFKSEALALRHMRGFGCRIDFSRRPYDTSAHARHFGETSALKLIIGTVDNPAARRAIAETLARRPGEYPDVWWIDAGNERDSGQIILGNALTPDGLHGTFDRATGRCFALPAPSLERPGLLEAPPAPEPRPDFDCAQAVALDEQSPTINGHMADWVAEYVHRLLTGTCVWARTLVNPARGTVHSVDIDPLAIAGGLGLDPGSLEPPPSPARKGPKRARRATRRAA